MEEINLERRGRASTSSFSLSESAMFSQRIVSIDFYSAPPTRDIDVMYSEFRGYEAKLVPVLRIYGSTPKGQKTCTHVHCVFPYIYIPFDPSVENLEYRLAIALDQAINLSIGTKDAKNFHHVFKIIKVTGKSMYGYHGSTETFLKIFFYNPWMIKKAAELLQNGAILNTKFQPFEAHIPYQLQFLIDYNLYGMNLIHFKSVKFRREVSISSYSVSPSSTSLLAFTAGGGQKIWNINQIPEYLCSPLSLDKVSRCELEVDVLGSDILVADTQSGVRSSNPGIDAIWMDEMERRRQDEVENWSQITIPESQNRLFDNKRFPTEEEHMTTLLNNIAMFDTTLEPESVDFDSTTFIPSSQLNQHTPSNLTFAKEVRLTSTAIKSNRADEELLNLLYEMENEKKHEEEIEEIGSSLGSQVVDVEDPHLEIVEEQIEDLWSESFFSDTLIDDMLDNAAKVAKDGSTDKWEKSNTMIQMDGQDDGSSSEEESKPFKGRRRSVRLSGDVSSVGQRKASKKSKVLEDVDEYPPTPPKVQPVVSSKSNTATKLKTLSKQGSSAKQSSPAKQSTSKKQESPSKLTTPVKLSAPAKLIAALTSSPRTAVLRKSASGNSADQKISSPQKNSHTSSESASVGVRSSSRVVHKTPKPQDKKVKSVSNKLSVTRKKISPSEGDIEDISEEVSTFPNPEPNGRDSEDSDSRMASIQSKCEVDPINVNVTIPEKNRPGRPPKKRKHLPKVIEVTELQIRLTPCDINTTPKKTDRFVARNETVSSGPKTPSPIKTKKTEIQNVNEMSVKQICTMVIEDGKKAEIPIEGELLASLELQIDEDKAAGFHKLTGSGEEEKFYILETDEVMEASTAERCVRTFFTTNSKIPINEASELTAKDGKLTNENGNLKATKKSLTSGKISDAPKLIRETCTASDVGTQIAKETILSQQESSISSLRNVGTQTFIREIKKKFNDTSSQTDLPDLPIFGPLCRCLSEMFKTFKDQGVDVQTDLVKKEFKKIQTEMGNILAEMKKNGSRFTGSTPSKRNDTDKTTPTRQSSKRSNETPTSSKSTNYGGSQSKSIPRLSPTSSIYAKYSSTTPSPRKLFRKRSHSPASPKLSSASPKMPLSSRHKPMSSGRRYGKRSPIRKSLQLNFNQVDMDLSINSVYEYSQSPTANESAPNDNRQVISQFQKRRSETKARTWNRVQNRKAKLLSAFNLAPDICEFEFEPMKAAPSYKVIEKWLLTREKRPDEDISANIDQQESNDKIGKDKSGDESSDEESIGEVRRAAGGNLSDEDDDDALLNDTCTPIVNSSIINVLSPATNSQFSCSSSLSNPKSILKMSNGRRINDKAKRKIRWEDEEPLKKSRTEELKKEANISGVSSLSISQTSWLGFGNISELDGPSPKNMFGFEHNMSNLQNAKALHHHQYLTTMCVEIHCDARGDFVPNPNQDAIKAIFVYFVNDAPENYKKPRRYFCNLIVDVDELIRSCLTSSQDGLYNEYIEDEISLINRFITLVHEWDPDILVGYEIQKQSWGYIIERGVHLGLNMLNDLSRIVPKKSAQRNQESKEESWNEMIAGRIVLNLWRLLRHEITVQSYTYENAAYHILHKRVHLFSFQQLALYWHDPLNRYKVFAFYHERTKGAIDIIEKLDLINRTSELARLFGIQFYEVLSRGSQFRVESMMLRVSKPKNFIPTSPSISQRAQMRAPEFVPLILEPHSNYYTDPVAVLDFQSLYPSMIIAYNYDYTSCLGRVEHLGKLGSFDFGCLKHTVPIDTLKFLKHNIHISPAGVAFLDSSVVKGIMPEMLEQILETRQMVKRAMKRWKDEDESLLKILDSRQLGLKLIANVTYGYTSANFSGRMPCVEIADSVVSKGRETLHRAIDLVKSNYDRWKADVVYGDTDSLFVRFIGRTREEAFVLAQEIVDEVTQTNPKPVKLKLEKIYQPCILQSKKRYVGYAYETPNQKEPKYDAKGIETVRRDGCPAVKKILEKVLHILFRTNSSHNVQQYVESQFRKIFLGRVSLQEFTFAREYRGRSGYKPSACVPSLEIAKKILLKDPRAEPLRSQRVPYVIVYGNPRLPLIQLVQTPLDFVKNTNLRLNAHYYIEKVLIPALNRCLLSARMDAHKWYSNLPRKYLRANCEPKDGKQSTLAHYFTSLNCLRCDGNTQNKSFICDVCRADGISTALYLQNQCYAIVDKTSGAQKICQQCSEEYNKCLNTDCPLFHKLIRYERDEEKYRRILTQLQSLDW